MRFAVEAWAPEYGTPFEADGAEPRPDVDHNVEIPAASWAPRAPGPAPEGATLLFIDGVQRIDAQVWIHAADGTARRGICASYAAGICRSDGSAEIAGVAVERGLFSSAPDAETVTTAHGSWPARAATGDTTEQLVQGLQQRMGRLEIAIAQQAGPADLVVVDGPLSGRQNVPGAIGYVKTHHARYLSEAVEHVIADLAAGQRTPVFLMTTSWTRYSWYLRLPGAAGHAWAGVVRCEASADLEPRAASALADRAAALLPRYASAAHKEPRAPQNLYPIAGLERELRRRLGDADLLYRSLLVAAAR